MARPGVPVGVAERKYISSACFHLVTFSHAVHLFLILSVRGIIGYQVVLMEPLY